MSIHSYIKESFDIERLQNLPMFKGFALANFDFSIFFWQRKGNNKCTICESIIRVLLLNIRDGHVYEWLEHSLVDHETKLRISPWLIFLGVTS